MRRFAEVFVLFVGVLVWARQSWPWHCQYAVCGGL